jgi:hypothetical protein
MVTWVGKLFGEDLSKNIAEVKFSGKPVTDAGLANLRGLTQLQELDLDSTEVTGVGLEHLWGLTQLEYLYLSDTKVTATGIAELQKALPNVQITR